MVAVLLCADVLGEMGSEDVLRRRPRSWSGGE